VRGVRCGARYRLSYATSSSASAPVDWFIVWRCWTPGGSVAFLHACGASFAQVARIHRTALNAPNAIHISLSDREDVKTQLLRGIDVEQYLLTHWTGANNSTTRDTPEGEIARPFNRQ